VGKGRKRRQVSVPSPAMRVLLQHLAARGHPVLETCPPDFPCLAGWISLSWYRRTAPSIKRSRAS
jgi:hypothetical protein